MSQLARSRTSSRPSPNPCPHATASALAVAVGAAFAGPILEHRFLREQLDRKVTTVVQLARQGLECDSLVERRAVFGVARKTARDILALLEALGRGPVDGVALAAARAAAQTVIDVLGPLTVPPPLAR